MKDHVDEHLSRDERRQRTEAAILQAAKAQFATAGFERTTIRSVAAAVPVDPALVMQHFGSKEGLFAAASRWSGEHQTLLSAPRDQVPAAALHDLFDHFETSHDEAVALLRNCLTHPEANRVVRDEVMSERASAVAHTIGGEQAELRAGLFAACMIGLGLARYVLELPAVAGASREDVQRLMQPVLQALVDPPPRAADSASDR